MIFSCAHEGCGERQDVVESEWHNNLTSFRVTLGEPWPDADDAGNSLPSARAWEATDPATGATCTIRWRCPAHRNPVPWMPLPI